MTVIDHLPSTNEATREALYGGSVYHLPATPASRDVVEGAWALLCERLGDDPRSAQCAVDDAAFFGHIGAIRRVMFLQPEWHERIRQLIASMGFDPSRVAFDQPRLRAIRSGGHRDPRAKSIYYPHRDTWYGHPPGIITWWVPLHDCQREETFVFHPQWFDQPVPNDSEVFDYDAWVEVDWNKKIGWQDRSTGLRERYPGLLRAVDCSNPVGFAAKRAESLLFAGAHLHSTLPQETGRTRFSLDFRIVHLDDHDQGRGAPSVDDRSRGSALRDYVHPPAGAHPDPS